MPTDCYWSFIANEFLLYFFAQVVNPKLFELSKSQSGGHNRSRYNGNNRSNGGNSFNRNNGNDRRPFGNNGGGNRPNNFGNGTDNAFKRDRDAGRTDNPSRFSNNDNTNRFSNHSATNTSVSRFAGNANASGANANPTRFGSNSTEFPAANKSAGTVRESRFSAPTPSTGSRFSNNDTYKSATNTDSFYANSASKFKSNGYDNKTKAPMASNPVAGGLNYQPGYNGYNAEAMFSYPPPPIH